MEGVKSSMTRDVERVQQIMGTTPRFEIVYDRGAHVLDVDVNDDGVFANDEKRKFENDPGISFPVIRKEYLGESLEHEVDARSFCRQA